MRTEVISVDPTEPAPDLIARAAAVLCRGGLVAFPTETVYGLGANALDAAAVAGIFSAKGRPATNPLIVHVPDRAAAARVVAAWPEVAERLARRFWPGPLTLVLPKREGVPAAVTAGGPTVAVRVPAHPVALALLRAAGVPVAAPSANASTRLSPTQARHVLRSLGGKIELVLDAGPTPGGIESTVVDLTVSPPRVLRPGLVASAEIGSVIGALEGRAPVRAPGGIAASPGLQPVHYAPRTRLLLVETNADKAAERLSAAGQKVGFIPFASPAEPIPAGAETLRLPPDSAGYAARLYAALHELDEKGLDVIVVEPPPDTEEWQAVRDRLQRAAARPSP